MRIYANIQKQSTDRLRLVATDDALTEHSTISSYYKTFFDGKLNWFKNGLLERSLNKCVNHTTDVDGDEYTEDYLFVGLAENQEELSKLFPEFFI